MAEDINWEPEEKISQFMSYLDDVEKQSERSPLSEKRTDKSSIVGMEIELEERKKEEIALKKALLA